MKAFSHFPSFSCFWPGSTSLERFKTRSRSVAYRDDSLFLLSVILTRFWSESRSLKQLQVASCKLNKKGYPISVHRSPRILGFRSRASTCSSFLGNRLRGGSEVRGMRLEVRRSRSLGSSDLLPLTSSSSQGRTGP